MKILMLSKALVVGTYQRKAEELAALPDVDLTVAVPPTWIEPGVGTLTLEQRYTTGYRMAVLPMWLNGHFHVHFYPGLKRLVELIKPDIFHIDEESFNFATFQAMQLGVQHRARCCFYNWANIERRYPPPFSTFEHYTLKHAAAAIAGNHEAAAIIQRHGYDGPIHVLPQFGVDPDLFYPAATPPDSEADQAFRIGYFGRMVESKGVLDLIEALAQLPSFVQLLLIGDGELLPKIEARIVELDLHERVTIRPRVPSGDVPQEMRRLHAFVLPSRTTPRWKEQFGRVLIEAMASGVPPVGSNSGEIPHVIADAGLIFQEGDSTDLAAKLRLLIEQPDLRAELARIGRARALDHYTQRALARSYYQVYQQMLDGQISAV
jgi:glycosyltransferase involved in cell wall biosynthesis